MTNVLAILIAFFMGGIPTGWILGKVVSGRDIREAGSGNIGTTNAFRTMGKTTGVLTFVGDCLKGFLAVKIGAALGDSDLLPMALAMVFVVIGHCYSPFLNFSGGKGIATLAGVGLAFAWKYALVVISLFALVLILSRIVSIASIAAAFSVVVSMLFMDFPLLVRVSAIIIACITISRHQTNIKRLLAGNENKIGGAHVASR